MSCIQRNQINFGSVTQRVAQSNEATNTKNQPSINSTFTALTEAVCLQSREYETEIEHDYVAANNRLFHRFTNESFDYQQDIKKLFNRLVKEPNLLSELRFPLLEKGNQPDLWETAYVLEDLTVLANQDLPDYLLQEVPSLLELLPQKSIEFYENQITNNPDKGRKRDAVIKIANIYWNDLGDSDKACAFLNESMEHETQKEYFITFAQLLEEKYVSCSNMTAAGGLLDEVIKRGFQDEKTLSRRAKYKNSEYFINFSKSAIFLPKHCLMSDAFHVLKAFKEIDEDAFAEVSSGPGFTALCYKKKGEEAQELWFSNYCDDPDELLKRHQLEEIRSDPNYRKFKVYHSLR